MFATQLIGKKAIRKRPCKLSIEGECDDNQTRYDYSYTRDPIVILAATESHIIYKHPEDSFLGRNFGNKSHILDLRWCDDNWTDYDELVKLAESDIQNLVNKTMELLNKGIV